MAVLAGEKYAGFNHNHRHSHRTQVLADREGIQLSRQTASRPLHRLGLVSSRRHRPPNTGSGGDECPGGARCCRSTSAATPGWRSGGPRLVLLPAAMEGIIHRYGDRRGLLKFYGQPRHVPQPVAPTQFTLATGGSGIECETPRAAQGPWFLLPNQPRWSGWELSRRSAVRGLCRGDGGDGDRYCCLAPGPGVEMRRAAWTEPRTCPAAYLPGRGEEHAGGPGAVPEVAVEDQALLTCSWVGQPSGRALLPIASLSSENVRLSAQGKCPLVWC